MSHSNEWQRVLRGILLLIGLHAAAIALGIVIAAIFYGIVALLPLTAQQSLYVVNYLLLYLLLGIGLTQFLYAIPAIILLNRDRQYALMKGVIIGTVLTALLNAGCFIWFNSQFR